MPKSLADLGIKTSAVPNEKRGYFLLSYHPFNYAAACKPCNSALKRDYFPIADAYNLIGEDPKQLKKEKPYLIYPIGDWDTDPEQLIRFHGVSPQPVAVKGYRRHRALVTIEFFELDNVNRRKNLIRERAVIIIALFPQGLDHRVGHFWPLSITRQRYLWVYHCIAMKHEGLCQVF
jgi:hypothetical protein